MTQLITKIDQISLSRFHLKKNPAWISWRIYPYSPGWFYKSREFPGLKYIEVESGYGGVVFIGETASDVVNDSYVLDFIKSVDLPAPTDPLLLHFGHDYDSCNSSADFNMDEEVTRFFHLFFADYYGCHIPFFGGDRFVARLSAKVPFCTRQSDYNTTQCLSFNFLTELKFTQLANRLLEKALLSIPNPPCNFTKLGLESLQVMHWADSDSQSPAGDLQKDTQMVTFMMPRSFEL